MLDNYESEAVWDLVGGDADFFTNPKDQVQDSLGKSLGFAH
jgi:hypothetical protein